MSCRPLGRNTRDTSLRVDNRGAREPGVTGCGDDDAADAPPAPTADSPAGTGTLAGATTFNEADIAFARGMIPHHRQAVEMADLALDSSAGAGEAVVDLATRVKAAQDPEIVEISGWLQQWGQPVTADSSGGHDMSDTAEGGDMGGMMTEEDIDQLAAAEGPEFDRLWMEMMIRHHEGAS